MKNLQGSRDLLLGADEEVFKYITRKDAFQIQLLQSVYIYFTYRKKASPWCSLLCYKKNNPVSPSVNPLIQREVKCYRRPEKKLNEPLQFQVASYSACNKPKSTYFRP